MDGSSETGTIVEESVELCDSPSILKGLFQIRHASTEIQPVKSDSQERISQELGIQDERDFTTSPSFPLDNADIEAHSPRDDTSAHSLSQQSEKSQSIFTQRFCRVLAKRKSPIVTLPNSPIFAKAPANKLPRSFDDASSSTGTHLSVHSPSCGYQAVQGQSVSVSPELLPNTQTQSSTTTIPSVLGITEEPKHPPVSVLHQRPTPPKPPSTPITDSDCSKPRHASETDELEVVEPAQSSNRGSTQEATYPSIPATSRQQRIPSPVPTTASLNSTQPNPIHCSPETQNGSRKTGVDVASGTTLQILGDGGKHIQKDDDDDLLIEMEKMQWAIREKMSGADEDAKHADLIKKNLQNMQARLRHLSARQREHRHQLSVRLKQQTIPSSGSTQQQQEARTQLQHMTRRQQRLLKLLQSHKELAASLQQMQQADHTTLQLSQTSGLSSYVSDSIQEVQHSSIKHPIKSPLPSKAMTPKETSVTASTLSLNPISQPKKIVQPTHTQVSDQILSKPAPEGTSTRLFKPPFKANQTPGPHQPEPPRFSLANDPASNKQKFGLVVEAESCSVAAIPDRSQSNPSPAVGDMSSPNSVAKDQRRSLHHSPPFSPSLDTSHDELLSETTGVLRKRNTLDEQSGQNPHDEPCQEATSIRPEGIPSLTVASVAQQDVTSQRTTPASVLTQKLHNTANSNTPVQNRSTTVTALPTLSTNNAPVCISLDQASEISLGLAKTHNAKAPLEHQTFVTQLLSQIQDKDPGSRQAIDASRSNQSGKVVVYKIDAGSMKDLGGNFIPLTTFETTPGGASFTVSKASEVTDSGSSQPENHSISIINHRPLLQNQSLSSSKYTVAPMEFQAPTSRISIPACTSVLPSPRSTVLSTADPQGKTSKAKAQKAVGVSGNPTQRVYTVQGRTKAQTPANSQAVATIVNSIEASGEDSTPTLQNLLHMNLIKPGKNVLSIKLKKSVVNASLNTDGTVCSTTEPTNFTCGSLCQMLSMVKHRSVNWIRKNPSVWKSVLYKGKSLNQLHMDYNALIARNLKLQSGLNAKSVTPAVKVTVATTKIHSQSSITVPDQRSNSDSAHHPAPSIPIQHNPTSSSSAGHNLASSAGLNRASSKGFDLVSRGSDLTPSAGHDFHSSLGRDHNTSKGCNVSSASNGLASSMRTVLLISNDELMPASWGVSPNFWSTTDISDVSIAPEWIEEIDVWT